MNIKPASPLPWKHWNVFGARVLKVWRVSTDEQVSRTVCMLADQQGSSDDAAYIVHAANNYPQLVEALENVVKYASRAQERLECIEFPLAIGDSIAKARAALAAARGKDVQP